MAETKGKQQDTGLIIPPAVEQMVRDLQDRAGGDDARSPEQMSMDILEQILNAPSLEEASGGTADLSGLLDTPLTVNLRAWQTSDIGELGVFAVIECIDGFDLENKKIVTCGGKNVVAILYRAENENRFPFKGLFREVETKQGYKTLWLDVLPE